MLTTTDSRYCDKMSSRMDTIDFANWLIEEMEKREWSQSDLARKANINRQVISTYVQRKRTKPDEDVLISIAHAFKLPPEIVFRAAGLLPPAVHIDDDMQQIIHEIDKLPKQDREEVLAYIRMLKNLRNKKK